LVAAICKVYGLPVSDRVRDHREVALPFGRKVDISTQYNMGDFRRRVAGLHASPALAVQRRPKRRDGKPRYPGLRKIGMHGKASGPGAFIAMIQRRLNEWGHKLKVDGDFGPRTRGAVAAFQRKRGIAPVTGAVGPRTWYALFDKPR
jgi:peptidoglycan hydrolase-like protein with peptidoglycan-binding domain